MILLYHGSDVVVKRPLASAGRRNLDFGEGFYLTRLPDQSRKWAKAVSSRSPANKEGIISIYEIDDTAFTEAGINYKNFEAYDLEWLDFVVACRQGRDNSSYHIVEGGIANDQVIDTVEDYENGRITAQQALDQLRFMKPTNQICLRRQNIIDKHLRFIGVESIKLDWNYEI